MTGSDLGKILLILGAVLAVAGVVLIVGSRLGLGRLPGNLSFTAGNAKVYIPLATCLILSVLLTIALNLFSRK